MMPKPFASWGETRVEFEGWVERSMRTEQTLVTGAVFTYVAVDQMGSPVPVARDESASSAD